MLAYPALAGGLTGIADQWIRPDKVSEMQRREKLFYGRAFLLSG